MTGMVNNPKPTKVASASDDTKDYRGDREAIALGLFALNVR